MVRYEQLFAKRGRSKWLHIVRRVQQPSQNLTPCWADEVFFLHRMPLKRSTLQCRVVYCCCRSLSREREPCPNTTAQYSPLPCTTKGTIFSTRRYACATTKPSAERRVWTKEGNMIRTAILSRNNTHTPKCAELCCLKPYSSSLDYISAGGRAGYGPK